MTKSLRIYGLICCLFAVLAGPVTAQQTFTEDFSTTNHRDSELTTADWDTGDGELKFFPFELSAVGSVDTPGACRDALFIGQYLYMADGYSGFQVVDVSDVSNPLIVATVNTPGYSYEVQVAGDYAFVADHNGGLRVVDVSDPASPSLVGSASTANVALGVAISGNLAIVAEGQYLEFFDISNPVSPQLIHTIDDPQAAYRRISIDGNFAYVVSGDQGLLVFDITDTSDPVLVGQYDTPATAFRVQVAGDVAYVLDQGTGIIVLDISDPSDPTLMNTLPGSGNTRGISLSGDKLYWADDANGLNVVDVSDPSNPAILHTFNTPGHAYEVVVSGEYAYVADLGAGLQILKVANYESIELAGDMEISGNANSLTVAGNFAYVASGSQGLQVVDVTDKLNPFQVGSAPCYGSANDVAVMGNWALMACSGTFGLQVYDISNPLSPVRRTSVATSGSAEGIFIQGNYCYLAAGSSGLQVYDIESEMGAHMVSNLSPSGQAHDVFVSGNYAYVAYGSAGLRVFDVSDPTNISLVGTHTTSSDALKVHVQENWAVLSLLEEFEIVDVSNPTTPQALGTRQLNGLLVWDVVLKGNLVFLATDLLEVQVFDVSDPANIPSANNGTHGLGDARRLFIEGEKIYLLSENSDSPGTAFLEIFQTYQSEVNSDLNTARSLYTSFNGFEILRYRVTQTGQGYAQFSIYSSPGTSTSSSLNYQWSSYPLGGDGFYWGSLLKWKPVTPVVSHLKFEFLSHNALIQSITDIDQDQGGKVRLQWRRSGHDFVGDDEQIVEYAIYRKFDAAEPEKTKGLNQAAGQSEVVIQNASTMLDSGWDFVTSVPVLVQDDYSVVVPTLADSTVSGGQNFSTFKIVSLTATPGVFFSSPADSGYSLDNLAPSVPTSLVANFQSDNVLIQWDDPVDADFQYFRVYRGTSSDFIPSQDNLVQQLVSTAWTDVVNNPAQYVYKISAIDFSGNESIAGTLEAVSGTPDAGLMSAFVLQGAYPNPFNPVTTIKYSLAEAAMVRLMVYDLAGHEVRSLVNESQSEGQHQVQWDGRNKAGGVVASGVYLYQLRSGENVEQRRMLLMK